MQTLYFWLIMDNSTSRLLISYILRPGGENHRFPPLFVADGGTKINLVALPLPVIPDRLKRVCIRVFWMRQ